MLSDAWGDFKAWWAHPFSADMDAPHWFYFFGLILVIATLWGLVLREMR